MKNLLLFFFLFIVTFSSCDTEVEPADGVDFGYEYFPLEVGNEWIYQVDSTVYFDEGNTVIQSSSQVREQIVELLNATEDSRKYELHRSIRANDGDNWVLSDVWTISTDKTRAFRTENNLKFIKLVFPIKAGTQWDGNSFFDDGRLVPVGAENIDVYADWDYRILQEGIGWTNDELSLDEAIEVEQVNYDNQLKLRVSKEFYAKNVGLVEREMEIYDTQVLDSLISWNNKAQSGYKLCQRLISYNIVN